MSNKPHLNNKHNVESKLKERLKMFDDIDKMVKNENSESSIKGNNINSQLENSKNFENFKRKNSNEKNKKANNSNISLYVDKKLNSEEKLSDFDSENKYNLPKQIENKNIIINAKKPNKKSVKNSKLNLTEFINVNHPNNKYEDNPFQYNKYSEFKNHNKNISNSKVKNHKSSDSRSKSNHKRPDKIEKEIQKEVKELNNDYDFYNFPLLKNININKEKNISNKEIINNNKYKSEIRTEKNFDNSKRDYLKINNTNPNVNLINNQNTHRKNLSSDCIIVPSNKSIYNNNKRTNKVKEDFGERLYNYKNLYDHKRKIKIEEEAKMIQNSSNPKITKKAKNIKRDGVNFQDRLYPFIKTNENSINRSRTRSNSKLSKELTEYEDNKSSDDIERINRNRNIYKNYKENINESGINVIYDKNFDLSLLNVDQENSYLNTNTIKGNYCNTNTRSESFDNLQKFHGYKKQVNIYNKKIYEKSKDKYMSSNFTPKLNKNSLNIARNLPPSEERLTNPKKLKSKSTKNLPTNNNENTLDNYDSNSPKISKPKSIKDFKRSEELYQKGLENLKKRERYSTIKKQMEENSYRQYSYKPIINSNFKMNKDNNNNYSNVEKEKSIKEDSYKLENSESLNFDLLSGKNSLKKNNYNSKNQNTIEEFDKYKKIYEKNLNWKKQVENKSEKIKSDQDKILVNELTFTPNINKTEIKSDEKFIGKNLEQIQDYVNRRRANIKKKEEDEEFKKRKFSLGKDFKMKPTIPKEFNLSKPKISYDNAITKYEKDNSRTPVKRNNININISKNDANRNFRNKKYSSSKKINQNKIDVNNMRSELKVNNFFDINDSHEENNNYNKANFSNEYQNEFNNQNRYIESYETNNRNNYYTENNFNKNKGAYSNFNSNINQGFSEEYEYNNENNINLSNDYQQQYESEIIRNNQYDNYNNQNYYNSNQNNYPNSNYNNQIEQNNYYNNQNNYSFSPNSDRNNYSYQNQSNYKNNNNNNNSYRLGESNTNKNEGQFEFINAIKNLHEKLSNLNV